VLKTIFKTSEKRFLRCESVLRCTKCSLPWFTIASHAWYAFIFKQHFTVYIKLIVVCVEVLFKSSQILFLLKFKFLVHALVWSEQNIFNA